VTNFHQAYFKMSPEVMRELLHLPEGTGILDCRGQWQCGYFHIELVIEHPDIPETLEGGRIPNISPVYHTNENGKTEFLRWS